ncbi:DUF4384 domain-containing protein [Oceanithermus sp.]
MKKIPALLALLGLLSACTITIRPSDVTVGVGYGVELNNVITRLEPDRGVGAAYYVGDEVRFIITLTQPGYVSLVAIDPDGRTYEFEHGVYLNAGTHVLPLPGAGHRYIVDYPTGKQRVRAIYTNTRPASVRFQGVYTRERFNERLRIYFRDCYAETRDVAETYFYIYSYR